MRTAITTCWISCGGRGGGGGTTSRFAPRCGRRIVYAFRQGGPLGPHAIRRRVRCRCHSIPPPGWTIPARLPPGIRPGTDPADNAPLCQRDFRPCSRQDRDHPQEPGRPDAPAVKSRRVPPPAPEADPSISHVVYRGLDHEGFSRWDPPGQVWTPALPALANPTDTGGPLTAFGSARTACCCFPFIETAVRAHRAAPNASWGWPA